MKSHSWFTSLPVKVSVGIILAVLVTVTYVSQSVWINLALLMAILGILVAYVRGTLVSDQRQESWLDILPVTLILIMVVFALLMALRLGPRFVSDLIAGLDPTPPRDDLFSLSALILSIALVGFGVLVYNYRPTWLETLLSRIGRATMGNWNAEIKLLVSVLLLSLGLRLVVVLTVEPILTPDSSGYFVPAWNLAEGHGYSAAAQAPFDPTMARPPGYSFFLAAISLIFGRRLEAAMLSQQVISLLVAYFVYRITRELFGQQLAVLSGVIVALHPILIYFSNIVLAEIVSGAWVTLAIFFGLLGLKREMTPWPWIASGVFFALAALSRTQFLLLAPGLTPFLFLMLRPRKALYAAFWVVMPTVIVAVLWTGRNDRLIGYRSYSAHTGLNLLTRTADLMTTGEESDLLATFNQQLTYNLANHTLGNQNMTVYRELSVQQTYGLMREAGHSLMDVERLMRSQALYNIAHKPLQYLLTSLRELSYLWLGYTPTWVFSRPAHYDVTLPLVGLFIARYVVGVPLIAIVSYGVCVALRKTTLSWLILYPLIYTSVTTPLVITGKNRFRMPVEPLVIIFLVVGLAAIWEHLQRRVHTPKELVE